MQSNSLFEEKWWLDSVAQNRWKEIVVKKDRNLVGRLPYVETVNRFGWCSISMPPLTQTLGPWIKQQEGKYANRFSREKEILEELMAQLPHHDLLDMRFDPSFQNWLPFFWEGYQQTTRYSYRFDDISDLDSLWDGMMSKIRTDIKKAEKQVFIEQSTDLELFKMLQDKTFERQDKANPVDFEIVKNIFEKAQKNEAFLMLVAKGKDNTLHAASVFVYDERCAYYLMAGADPEFRNSGAQSLILWEALKHFSGKVQKFDFEGSMEKPIERFYRGFGAKLTPYFHITKKSKRIKLLHQVARIMGRS